MEENIVISNPRQGIITISFATQKFSVDEEAIRRILRSGQFTGEIAGFKLDYLKRGMIIIVANPTAWKGPDAVIKKLKTAIEG